MGGAKLHCGRSHATLWAEPPYTGFGDPTMWEEPYHSERVSPRLWTQPHDIVGGEKEVLCWPSFQVNLVTH